MGRPRKSRALAIWMNGERVGTWRLSSRGAQEFVYAESWLASPAARPISLSLPLRPSGEPYRAGVEAFFENLLPDSREIRERIQRRFRVATTRASDLLPEVGRDCVGALQVLSEEGPPPDVKRINATRLTNDDVAQLLTRSLGVALGPADADDEEFRISLAGAQEKTALLWHDGSWHRPKGATPTTHIIKLPIGVNPLGIDLSTSVENEWLCARIVQEFGISVAACRMETFGERKTLIVERFDRKLAENRRWWLRLPQEDLCQATGTPPGLKYENDGGPGIRTVMDLLLGSQRPVEDRRDFMRTQLVYWLLAAIDGHAKNFSLSLLPQGAYHLTPRYDILSAYPMIGHGRGTIAPQKLAMAMALEGKNRHYGWQGIRARHWRETAKRCGFPEMDDLMTDVIERVPVVINRMRHAIPTGFPPEIAASILDGMHSATEQLKADLVGS